MAAIKNQYSNVPSANSIVSIEKALVGMGAKKITKEYQGEELKAISFQVMTENGNAHFLLEAKIESCYEIILEQYKKPTDKSRENARAQAERTVWKIVSDWVLAHAAMVRLGQSEVTEAFFANLFDPASGKTVFQIAKSNNFKLLKP